MADNNNLGDAFKQAAQTIKTNAANSATQAGTSGIRTTSGGPTGVRRRKGQTLGGAIAGVFIGIILILASPFILWKAENQHTAKDFQSALPIEATDDASGYVTFAATPEIDVPLTCGEQAAECLYYNVKEQMLTTVQEEQCGNISQDARIIEKTVLECDEDGLNCEQCYMVERDVWETQNEVSQYTDVTLGNYTVQFNDSAIMLGLEEETIMLSETERDVWTYFPLPNTLRVAGDVNGTTVSGAESTYVLSLYSYEQTISELEARDAANKWLFRIITFAMLFIGFSGILGPISYFTHVMRKIPLVGGVLKEGGSFLVGLVSFLLAVVSFLALWLIVSVIKNIVIVVLLIVIVLSGLGIYTYSKKDKPEAKPQA
jgi:uncharacterized protein YpmB